MRSRLLALGAVATLFAVLVSGCGPQEYPENLNYEFTPHPSLNPNTKEKDIFTVPDSVAREVNKGLKPIFGTPRHPRVNGISDSVKTKLGLDEEMLEGAADPRREGGNSLYRKLCLHCHGLTGDGNGPTGEFLNPRPRDYRKGLFKFKSTVFGTDITRPSRSDLKRTVLNGIPGTSMPAFNLLSDDEIESLVSYVIHLSIRGEVEARLAAALNGGNTSFDEDAATKKVAADWVKLSANHVEPSPDAQWSAVEKQGRATNWSRGRQLFVGNGGCVKCHGMDGRASPIDVPENVTLRNAWGDLNPPRNLTLGVFRGGSRPIDLFYRLRTGVAGTEMPIANLLTDEEVWHVIGYVYSLSSQR